MTETNHRQIARDSLFVLADVRLDGREGELRVRVRNLSSGGMMAELAEPLPLERGALLKVNIRNIGWVDGSVAWVQDNRFGIALAREIDTRLARAPAQAANKDLPDYIARRPLGVLNTGPDPAQLRKI